MKSNVATGAIAGKLIVGGLTGAALGAILSTTVYFVITYKSDNIIKSIVFDTYLSGTFASKVTKIFKERICNQPIEHTEL